MIDTLFYSDAVDDDMYDEVIDTDDGENDEESFQIQLVDDSKKYVLVNTRVDYQYLSDNLNSVCLCNFVSIFYKKKMNNTDQKHWSMIAALEKERMNKKGRPTNERFVFQKQHPQAATHLLMKYNEPHIPILYGPQIPRQDRDDTRERYCRAILTLFVPWRTVIDLCDIHQTWEKAFKTRRHLVLRHL